MLDKFKQTQKTNPPPGTTSSKGKSAGQILLEQSTDEVDKLLKEAGDRINSLKDKKKPKQDNCWC